MESDRYIAGWSTILATKKRIDDGNWHQVAIVKMAAVEWLYVDAELADVADDVTEGQDVSNDSPIYIGTWPNHLETTFTGCIDTLLFYQRALSQVELRALLKATAEF